MTGHLTIDLPVRPEQPVGHPAAAVGADTWTLGVDLGVKVVGGLKLNEVVVHRRSDSTAGAGSHGYYVDSKDFFDNQSQGVQRQAGAQNLPILRHQGAHALYVPADIGAYVYRSTPHLRFNPSQAKTFYNFTITAPAGHNLDDLESIHLTFEKVI